MTKEIKDLLKFIIRKCDLVINNENYTADEYAQDKIEDIAEMCHRVLDGQFGEIIEPSLPSDLDEAANNYGIDIRLGYPRVMDETDRYIYNAFKAGAEWIAGQGVSVDGKVIMDFSEPYDIINRRLIAKLGDALLEIEPGEVVVQIRKK